MLKVLLALYIPDVYTNEWNRTRIESMNLPVALIEAYTIAGYYFC